MYSTSTYSFKILFSFIVVLTCISLVVRDVEHIACSLSPCKCSFWRIRASVHLLSELLVSLILNFQIIK